MIDADVARACGGENAVHPTAANTRDFLQAVLTICHKAVMTPEMQREWNKHQSSFARKWRRSMVAKKKLVMLNLDEHDALRQGIRTQDLSDNKKKAMLKDCHLIEAALNAGYSIISMDDVARGLFSGAANSIADLHTVLWINPARDHEKVIGWLKDGAPIDGAQRRQWRLGAHVAV